MKSLALRLTAAVAFSLALSLALASVSCSGDDNKDGPDTIAVTGVTLQQTLPMTEGGTATLTATIVPASAANKAVTWTNGDPAKVAITGSGLTVTLNALAPGTSSIIVTTEDGGKTATCTVIVAAVGVPVTGVALEPTAMLLSLGESRPLVATVAPVAATNKAVAWLSDNTAVAGITGEGAAVAVNAVSPGDTIITVTTDDGQKTATCAVHVATPGEVTRLLLPKTTAIRTSGGQGRLTADLWPLDATNKGVVWSSDAPGVAAVSGAGITATLAGLAVGTARITATSLENPAIGDYCDVTVMQSVWNETHLAGEFGVIKDGGMDSAYDGNAMYGVAVGGDGAVHASGCRYWDGVWYPVYFKNGEGAYLPMSPGMVEGAGTGIHVTDDGHVYISGYEYSDITNKCTPKLWLDGAEVTLGGLDGIPSARAMGVHVAGGNVYVSGDRLGEDYIDCAILWINNKPTIYESVRYSASSVTTFGGSVHVGGGFGVMRLSNPSNPASYQLLPAYAGQDDGVNSVRAIGDDFYAAGWLGFHPAVWKNHVPTRLPWDEENPWFHVAQATDVAVAQDGTVFVLGEELEMAMWLGFPHPVLWKDGVKQPVPDFYEHAARSVAIRGVTGVPVTSVTLDESLNVPVGYTRTLAATILPGNSSYRNVKWASSNPAVASITGGDLTVTVNGLALGEATIKATSPDGPVGECIVTVHRVYVEGVELPPTLQIGAGRSAKLFAVVSPAEATEKGVLWHSDNPGIATVVGAELMAGVVSAVSIGAANITATTLDGTYTSTCAVSVVSPSQVEGPSIYVAGPFGLYIDGWHDTAWPGGLSDVLVDDAGVAHGAGIFEDGDVVRGAYYRDGVRTVLQATLPSPALVNTGGMAMAPNGDVYIAGYEVSNNGNSYAAKLWKVAPDGTITLVPLEGGQSMAHGVCVHGDDVYVSGFTFPVCAVWKNGAITTFGLWNQLRNIGVTTDGTVYLITASDYAHVATPDLSSWAPYAPVQEYGRVGSLFVDGDDIYMASYTTSGGSYLRYWKNGVSFPIERTEGTRFSEANDIYVHDGHVYVVGIASGYEPGVWPELWIDGLPIHDDRSIQLTGSDDYEVRPTAVFVR
jgi:uncharacterized protein YjdB